METHQSFSRCHSLEEVAWLNLGSSKKLLSWTLESLKLGDKNDSPGGTWGSKDSIPTTTFLLGFINNLRDGGGQATINIKVNITEVDPVMGCDGANTDLRDENARDRILDGKADGEDLGEDNEIGGDDVGDDTDGDDKEEVDHWVILEERKELA